MRNILTILPIAAALAVAACGGGGDDGAPPPVNSTSTFAVRSAFDGAVSAGLVTNLFGRDNALRSVNRDDFNDWSGTFSETKRVATATTTICAGATILVDLYMVLQRTRDGLRLQDGVTFAFDNEYKPVCARGLNGTIWTWSSAQPLPVSSTVGASVTGVTIGSPLTGMVTLDADTSNSAYLSFIYNLPAGGTPLDLFGDTTEFRYRIDPSGKLLGFQYVRTGIIAGVGDSTTVTLNAQ